MRMGTWGPQRLTSDELDEIARLERQDRSNSNPLWDDDLIQFARLLAEIAATHDGLDIQTLCESMDLEPSDINELFDRADAVWERAKAQL